MKHEMTAGFRKMRVWVEELPDVGCPSVSKVHERCIETDPRVQREKSCAAVEVFVPTGGRALYGSLGATFVSNRSDRLCVEVVTCESHPPAPPWAFASRIDDLRTGLSPGDYVRYIWEGAFAAAREVDLGPGVLRFDRAVLGGVGSGPIVFRWLARTVVRVISASGKIREPEDVASIIHPRSVVLAQW